MKFKPVPPAPDSLDGLRAVRDALPLVPDSEADCCACVVARTPVPDHDAARTWLAFLRALGLVDAFERGYARTDADASRERLAAAFETNVFAASETLAVLREAAGPLDADATFDRVRELVPNWERARSPEWDDRWRERTRRVLDWAVLFGLAERSDGGFGAR